jgi:electron transport complex protein RnfC
MLFDNHGLFLPDEKRPAATLPIGVPRARNVLTLPLSFTETVEKVNRRPGAKVNAGDVLYRDKEGFPSFATLSGVLEQYGQISHPLYGELICGMIRPEEGEERLLPLTVDPAVATPEQIISIAKEAGIIDERDGVPLWEKLELYKGKGGHVVIDGTEPQFYTSAAFAVLLESPDEMGVALSLAQRVTGAKTGNIAVCLEDTALIKALGEKYTENRLYIGQKRYPVQQFTAEKEKTPVCFGVQAMKALFDAVVDRKSATHIVVTVAGDGVRAPQNLRVPFGTPVQHLLEYCEVENDVTAVIAGDILTGTALQDTSVPVLPGMTCILALKTVSPVENDPCIGCGRCADACHKHLLPYEISRRLENMHYERLQHLHPERCDGCGACSFVCPSARDLMQAVRYAASTDGSVFLDWGGNDRDA